LRAGRAEAAARGVEVRAQERVVPLGDAWLIRTEAGFEPCPWAFDVSRFAPARGGDRVLDLGCGGGVLLCALAQVHAGLRALVGVELEPTAADQARRNLALSGLAGVIALGDVRVPPVAPRAFDLVLCNPPFYPPNWGRESRDRATHASTHALSGDVADFARAAAHALTPHGRAVFVYDAGHLATLLFALAEAGLTARAIRGLVDDRGATARVLVLAGREGAGLIVDRGPGCR
jgi:SAM-dependent methyltransferase